MSETTRVEIDRAIFENGDLNLTELMKELRNAVDNNYEEFGGKEYSMWIVAVYFGYVIVETNSGTYYRAEYNVDENGQVTFSNIQPVQRQFVPFEIERSADTQPVIIEIPRHGDLQWGSIL
jgi:hypothetical protein